MALWLVFIFLFLNAIESKIKRTQKIMLMISGTITAAINTLSRGMVIARLTSILGKTLTSKAARTAIIITTTTHTHLTEAAPALSTVSTLLLSTGPVKDALDINTFINVVIPLIKEPILITRYTTGKTAIPIILISLAFFP